jgi:AcrR family transcriptional regulator
MARPDAPSEKTTRRPRIGLAAGPAKRAAAATKKVGRPAKVQPQAEDSRDYIMRVATGLFAAKGLHVPSIRDVTQAAGVNVALIKYYFGNKQGLLEAAIRNAALPVIAERHRLLDECVLAAGTGAEYVHRLITAYVQPVLNLAEEGATGAARRRIIGLAWADPDPAVRELMDALFNGAARRLVSILRSACDHLRVEELNWRCACLFSVIYTLYTEPGRMRNMVGANVNLKDREGLLNYVVPFMVAGLTHR